MQHQPENTDLSNLTSSAWRPSSFKYCCNCFTKNTNFPPRELTRSEVRVNASPSQTGCKINFLIHCLNSLWLFTLYQQLTQYIIIVFGWWVKKIYQPLAYYQNEFGANFVPWSQTKNFHRCNNLKYSYLLNFLHLLRQ